MAGYAYYVIQRNVTINDNNVDCLLSGPAKGRPLNGPPPARSRRERQAGREEPHPQPQPRFTSVALPEMS